MEKNEVKQKNKWIMRFARPLAILVVMIMLVSSVTSLAFSYYIKKSADVTGIFTPAGSVALGISEEPEPNKIVNVSMRSETNEVVKENVYFEVGEAEYPVYVRATIVVSWKDDNGVVYFSSPVEGVDYTLALQLDSDSGWVERNGLYYYRLPVASGGKTTALIDSCRQIKEAPTGYKLSVEVVVQSVQAIGTADRNGLPAYQDAWELNTAL